MTQDYVRSARPSRKRKPASRSGSTRRAAPPAFPIVRVVLAAALVIGFAIFLYVLKGSADDPQTAGKNKPAVKPIPIEEQRPAKEICLFTRGLNPLIKLDYNGFHNDNLSLSSREY